MLFILGGSNIKACVLCGYGGGAMTRAIMSHTIVKSLLKVWNGEKDGMHKHTTSCEVFEKEIDAFPSSKSGLEVDEESVLKPKIVDTSTDLVKVQISTNLLQHNLTSVSNFKVHNSITAGVLDPAVKQWIHMVCGLWTPGTRCPNVDTMSAFDVSGVSRPRADVVCSICNRRGGSCIKCRIADCSVKFHPWCAHQKNLLQSENEGIDDEKIGFYGICMLHTIDPRCLSIYDPTDEMGSQEEKEFTCARAEGYKGRRWDGFQNNHCQGGLVPEEQLNAWIHINGQKLCSLGLPKFPDLDIEHDSRKEYARYKQAKGWKHLVVYKSRIHALGLYTSRFISRGEMVVEYIGEIVGLRVADKREKEYQSGRKLQYKSACYFFRIDKEHIIDATRKGGIARFVNHSCLPNCVAKVITVRHEKKVVFFAERDIFPGEEITYDYHFNHEDEGKIPCYCNSKNCRRYMN
ncbi:Histone-lysine N-methyltransferase ATX1 [Spatholobus suberectus]|nr:Histone-lysine N-methyltransferase ATX1 [Spatholobus suberectus]